MIVYDEGTEPGVAAERQRQWRRYGRLRPERLDLPIRVTLRIAQPGQGVESAGPTRSEAWHPPVAWSTRRLLGRRATRAEQARWSERLRSLEDRRLITTIGSTRGGVRRTTHASLTPQGVRALRALAASVGGSLDVGVLRLRRRVAAFAGEPGSADWAKTRSQFFVANSGPQPTVSQTAKAARAERAEVLELEEALGFR